MSNAVIGSISVDALLAARDDAVSTLHDCGRRWRAAADHLGQFAKYLPRVQFHFTGGHAVDFTDWERYGDRIRCEIDRLCWQAIMEGMQIDTLMSSARRTEFERMIHESPAFKETGLPALTAENIEATVRDLAGKAEEYFEECIESVYRSLCWDRVTNTPGRIGDKLIMRHGNLTWSERRFQGRTAGLHHSTTLCDLERALLLLDGQPTATHQSGVRSLREVPWGEWVTAPPTDPTKGSVMSIKVHHNGNLHVRIDRPILVERMNAVMAKKYPDQVGTGDRRKNRKEGAA